MTGAVVSDEARIGRNVTIGPGTIVYDNVVLEDDVQVGPFCSIGQPAGGPYAGEPLVLGRGSVIRSHTVLYEGSRFEAGLETGHHTLVREGTTAGARLRLGSFCDVEGRCEFGDHVRCHGYVHVGVGSRIGSFVWLYSLVTLTNDPLPPSNIERPVTLEDGVVVCVNATVMPGTVMRKGSFAAAGTLVQGEIPMGAIVAGPDSRVSGHVSALMDLATGTRHPWMRHFHVRYPEDQHERLARLGEEIARSRHDGRTK